MTFLVSGVTPLNSMTSDNYILKIATFMNAFVLNSWKRIKAPKTSLRNKSLNHLNISVLHSESICSFFKRYPNSVPLILGM